MAKVLIVGDQELREAIMAVIKIECVETAMQEHDYVVHAHSPSSFDKMAVAVLIADTIGGPPKGVQTILLMASFEEEDYAENQKVFEFIHAHIVSHMTSVEQVADYLNKFYVEPPPFSPYMVECTIERDGPTEIYQDGVRYFFEKNACGHYVCLVQRNDHRKRLCSIDGFRIYQKDKLPEPEFTDEEVEFMQTWRTMDKDSFAEFVNGRLREFRLSREKVRRIAIEKWIALHHRDKTPMPCPIDIPDDPFAVVDENDPAPPADESESWTDEQWASWTNTWVRLTAERFEKFVEEQETKLLNCPDDVWDRAKEKWAKLMPDKPWPIDPDEE